MNRIDRVFEQCKAEKRLAFIPYVTAGDPSLDVTEKLLEELARNGADIVELGVPFSDPMADGPTIQDACERALRAGANLSNILDLVARLRARGFSTPIVLFSYYNVLFHHGIEDLARRSAETGIDAWLTVDVPVEEVGEIKPALDRHGVHWIALVAPTTPPERVQKIVRHAGGFIYYITVTGVTGARSGLPDDVRGHLDLIRKSTSVPVAAGFGISSPDMVRQIGRHADAVVVGSKIVKTLHDAPTPAEGIRAVGTLARALSDACRGN